MTACPPPSMYLESEPIGTGSRSDSPLSGIQPESLALFSSQCFAAFLAPLSCIHREQQLRFRVVGKSTSSEGRFKRACPMESTRASVDYAYGGQTTHHSSTPESEPLSNPKL